LGKINTMSKDGPIIIVDDDPDDQHLAKEVINSIGMANPVLPFYTALDALKYLMNEMEDQPFIILSDINLPKMNGIELKKAIEANDELCKRAIPFVFYSTSGEKSIVDKAFELQVQGFFVKANSLEEMRRNFRIIFDYWRVSRHPNN
jgi:CheY-like chemotaxis protein